MRNRLREARLLVLAACLLLSPIGAMAAEVNHSWDQLVRTVKTGSRLTVARMSSAEVQGKLRSIDDQSMVIEYGGARQEIARDDVYRVRLAGRRARRAFLGMWIGAAVGALVTVAIDSKSKDPRPGEAAGIGAIFFGLPGGAIVGAALPVGPPLYEAAAIRRKDR